MAINWRDLPPLSALRAFAAVAELGGFSQAARALNVTHAAVAQQVRALEALMDTPLVARDGRGMALTAEGQQLAQALADGFGTIASGVAALRAGGSDRPVRITLTASFASQWLMPRLKDFWDLHPDIALSLHPDARVSDLRRDGMDLGIRYGNGDWPGVTARFLAPARMAIAAAPDLLDGRENLSTAEMQEMEWILARDWPEQENYLRSLGLDPRTLSRTDFVNEELSLAAARQGLGLVVESLALMEDDLEEGRLILLHDSKDRLPAYFIVTSPGPQRAATRAFLKWLESAA
ncbi:LysR family transcriptional regulator [Rhodobacter sp. HX-7-19]|uniref:LysR family transcriptional regulator n=1 Tax=Paragemmobacter kunshanensis TaxID=2583234 RepID=A0A6M1TUN7_9RHOB|nr:LysR family transcriptional regulator [Rhodobacter kunshanensis]NGQ89672.1 LysR family transcriptional regulator [Rhodobacter kunshanensis]